MKAKFLFCAILTMCVEFAFGQITPIRYYPLDNGSVKETINRKDGTFHGAMSPYTDRFGRANNAMQLLKKSYISTPNFFEGSSYSSGYSISFWINIPDSVHKKTGVIPWAESDPVHRIFYAADAQKKAMMGFYYRGDRAVIDRYVVNSKTGDFGSYGIWYWDPINFTDRVGWYQIFIVQQTNKATIYLFSPEGRMEYALHYMGMQNLASTAYWGIGGEDNNAPCIIDDFKVYAQALTKDQVITLNSLESVPDGMYTVTSAYNTNQFWQTASKSTSLGALVNIHEDATEGSELTKQWVFEPDLTKYNVCKIRMAYTNHYLAAPDVSTGEDVTIDLSDANVNWNVESTGDGYFFIRSTKRPELYLKSVSQPFSTVRILRTALYDSSEAPLYKWRLNHLKFKYDLTKNLFNPNMGYEMVASKNTVYGPVPVRPFTKDSSPLQVNRDDYTSLSNHYTFKKSIDDSYVVYSKSFPTKAMHPQDRTFASKQAVELNEWRSGWSDYYKFIVERPNPLGRKVLLKPVLAQTFSVYGGDYPTKDNVYFKTIGEGLEDGHYWQLYADRNMLNQNKQISTIEPGIYKITTLLNEYCSMRPSMFSFQSNNILLGIFTNERRTSYYWYVDYEKDQSGQPVKDGAYTIQLNGTDALYLGSTYASLPEKSKAETIIMDRDNIGLSKWFITPTRDGTGSFFLQSASDKLKYLHCQNASGLDYTPIEYYYMRSQEEQKAYKWKFERVDIPTPLEPGVYRIRISTELLYAHTTNNSISEKTTVELGTLDEGGTYNWIVELNPDKTYSIRTQASTYPLYLHTQDNRLTGSAPLEIKSYDSSKSHTYKWLITKAKDADTYYLQLIAYPAEGYMHLYSNYLLYGTPLEIYKYVDVVDESYTWKFEKVE